MTNEDKYRTLDNLRRWSEAVDDDATYSRMLAALRRIGEWEPESGEPMPYAREVVEWEAQFAAGAESRPAAPITAKMEQNALPLIGVLAALAIVLAAGWIWALRTTAGARETAAAAVAEREAVATAGRAIQATAAAQETRFALLQGQSTVAAATFSALATGDAVIIEALRATVTTVPATPEPLTVTAALAGAAPVPGTVGEGVPVFYDRPASMNVTAPPGWMFRLPPNRTMQVIDPDGNAWELQLKIAMLKSDSVVATVNTGIPSGIVSVNTDNPNSRTIDLASLPVVLPRESGHYRLNWEAESGDGRRMIGASPMEFELFVLPTVKVKEIWGVRSLPIWRQGYQVPGFSGQDVEVLGKLDLDDTETEYRFPPPTPDFLMVRRPGQTDIFWLPSIGADLYGADGTGAEWLALINSLPDVPPPAAPPEEEE